MHDRAGILNVVLDMVAKNLEVDASTSLSFFTRRLDFEVSSREPFARVLSCSISRSKNFPPIADQLTS